MIDLSKCFDSVPHDKLLNKLSFYGIKGVEHCWFESYLKEREQIVNFNNQTSGKEKINIGVPQGTVLGPILFLIYMNELPMILPNLSCTMFADDITISCAAKNIDEASASLQTIVNKTVNWLDKNRLVINISKCNSLIICSKHKNNSKLDIYIKGQHIEQITECKLLGVYIDQNLSFNKQCTEVSRKICKKFGLLKRLRCVLPLSTISKLYFPLVQSNIDYCLSVWGNCSTSSLSIIQKLQNRIGRFLTGKYDYLKYPSSLLRNDLNWMSVSDRYKYFISILMYKCVNNPNENPLSKFFTFSKSIHNYKTRKALNEDLAIPKLRTEQFKRSLIFSGPIIWNKINLETCKLNLFYFKKHFKDNLYF